jgi:hypothetical protein
VLPQVGRITDNVMRIRKGDRELVHLEIQTE